MINKGKIELAHPQGAKGAVEDLTEYWRTYDTQFGYEKYPVGTILDDALYGIGIAINREKYSFRDGFDRFKKDLLEQLI